MNDVVRMLIALASGLKRHGHHLVTLTPEGLRSLFRLLYTEIGLTRVKAKEIGSEINAARPEAIDIFTEGPIGWAAKPVDVAQPPARLQG